jgi:hypothetical protein
MNLKSQKSRTNEAVPEVDLLLYPFHLFVSLTVLVFCKYVVRKQRKPVRLGVQRLGDLSLRPRMPSNRRAACSRHVGCFFLRFVCRVSIPAPEGRGGRVQNAGGGLPMVAVSLGGVSLLRMARCVVAQDGDAEGSTRPKPVAKRHHSTTLRE